MTKTIILAGITGLTALIMSSLSAHAIRPMLIVNGSFESFSTAQRILMSQSILAIVAATLGHYFGIKLFHYAGIGFLLGSLLFAITIVR